jgi:hypothetical protein
LIFRRDLSRRKFHRCRSYSAIFDFMHSGAVQEVTSRKPVRAGAALLCLLLP